VTHADRELQDRVNRYQVDGAPKVTHLIAASEGYAKRIGAISYGEHLTRG